MRIAVDFDGVLFDHVPYILRAFRDEFDIDLEAEGLRHWDYFHYRAVQDADLSYKTVRKMLSAIETDPFLHQEDPRDDLAAPVMQEWMDEGHHVSIVTARHEESRAATQMFLERNRIPHHEVRMATHIKTGYDLLIDDAPHNVLMAAADGGRALLMDHPYNRDVPTHSNPTRVRDWEDVRSVARAYLHRTRVDPVAAMVA